MSLLPPLKKRLWVWYLWLLTFYGIWLFLVVGLDYWETAKEHWPIAMAMALGSYAAGSTPMGGGTIGFPVLVLLFDQPASLGRDFSFAVQSIGMTSASLLILARRQPLAFALLKGALLGTLLGSPIGIFVIAPFIPELLIKLIFAILWAGFGLLHFYRINEIAGHSGMIDFNEVWDFRLGMVLGGIASATVVSVTGVGIDMVVYAALVLLCRADLKIAIPTSVVIMAFASIYGVLLKVPTIGLQPGVFENWLAAAPIVVLGAPLGAVVVSLVSRKSTLLFVATLCVGQFIWTCIHEFEELGLGGIALSTLAVATLLYGFERLHRWGAILAGDRHSDRHLSSLGIPEVEPHTHSDSEKR